MKKIYLTVGMLMILIGCDGVNPKISQEIEQVKSPETTQTTTKEPIENKDKNQTKENDNEQTDKNRDKNKARERERVKDKNNSKECQKGEKCKKKLYKRASVNSPEEPTASISFSFNDALVGEPILAIVEFSEDVEPIDKDSFELSGADIKKFERVTPKLYRFVLMPKASSNQIRLKLQRGATVDADGNILKGDVQASASIAKAPWGTKLRRYRGTIETVLSYKSGSKKMDILMIWIRPGEFDMGCSGFDEKHCEDDETPHKVTLTKGFWLSRTEITQWQWRVVMGDNPSFFASSSEDEQRKLPVESISYDDAKSFAQKLLKNYTAKADLPTEAEWEYAMRSSTKTAYYDNPDDIKGDANSKAAYYIGWYAGNSSEWNYKKLNQTPPENAQDLSNLYDDFFKKASSSFGTHYIMQKANSDWRLKDMAGNVAEWCRDWYTSDLGSDEQVDPQGALNGTQRVVKGGSWYDPATMLRSASREGVSPSTKSNRIGLRIAIYPGGE